MLSARSLVIASTLLLFGLLSSSCGFGDLLAPEPSATPTRTRRPTATATPLDTDTPTATATPLNTATFTPQPPTATFTQAPPTNTFTPQPPTATFTRRPPTATFTKAPPPPPTNTPPAAFLLTFRWIDQGRPMTPNQCSFVNGTHVEGRLLRAVDGTVISGQQKTAAMHLWIKGDNGGPYASPGIYRQFPTENDGRWNAEFPKRSTDFEWHIYVGPPLSDDSFSADLWGVSSAADKCGEPSSKNWFVVDWILN
jgi:hypothetical protein